MNGEVPQEILDEISRERAVLQQVHTMMERSNLAFYRGLHSLIKEGGVTFEEVLEALDVMSDLADDFEHWYEIQEKPNE